ncbi:predicted protein [Naegleria gruberi]|uniref:Predicted protein n=1 Tax=Naegleria gruberi TaxID=5762 RepID=D2V1X5_NAEGR|nr:uncharacterized protein NAEGRDRAFT_62728 [Naegleria gruberi]EFC49388.1 predicted protein [Naegleria gruberi]|eukprot:XP_002682132.1 predicted protein [Naegleria gruberi strain NEG-M]
MCPIVKEWINEDQKENSKTTTTDAETPMDLSFLPHLDTMIKYEIIEFIPTYAKWKSIREVDAHYERHGMPKVTNRVNELRPDQPIITIQHLIQILLMNMIFLKVNTILKQKKNQSTM